MVRAILRPPLRSKALVDELRGYLSQLEVHMQAAMNSFLPNGLQHPLNLFAGSGGGGFVQPLRAPTPLVPATVGVGHLGAIPGLPLHLLQQQQQQQVQELNKLLHLDLIQRQFVLNFAFTNCSNYHPQQVAQAPQEKSGAGQKCENIEQDIWNQLKLTKPAASSVGSESSRASSPLLEEESIEDPTEEDEDDMNRGLKRPLQSGHQPWHTHQKRARSEDREEYTGHQQKQHVASTIPYEFKQMSEAINGYYNQYQQQQEMYASKMKLRDALYAIMKGVFPYCGLYVVGSSMNGFGSASSDMDLCLMLSHSQVDQKREATEILRILLKALKKCTFLQDIILIKAKVPILKFTDKISQVECDLNINNSVGIRNTHLLNAYAKMDWRVSPLVLFIKYWAKYHNINDAKEGTISSYSLGLMIIHYLQCGVKPPVLPCLQQEFPNKFNGAVDVRVLTLNDNLPEYTSSNTQSLGELFLGFLHYYTHVFNFNSDAISVRLGRRLPRDVVTRQNPQVNNPSQWKCLCIEEPYDLSNTARSVYDQHTFMGVMRVFRQSYGRLQQSRDLTSIIDVPF